MHRVIMGADADGLVVDHIDRNGLNNTRANLRCITQSENAHYLAEALGRQHIHRVTSKGRVYYYHRKTGTRLPDDPQSAAFKAAVEELNTNVPTAIL